MNDLEQEWMNFTEYNDSAVVKNTNASIDAMPSITPECSDIYISTKTKICYLNTPLDIFKIYWQLPILDYHVQSEGIIKKSLKLIVKIKKTAID